MPHRTGAGALFFTFRHTALAALVVGAAMVATPVAIESQAKVDTAFARFWSAQTPKKAEEAVAGVLASGVTYGDALARLRAGKTYSRAVPTGIIQTVGAFPHTIVVPEDYSPHKQYQVRVHLHGGISFAQPVAARGLDEMADDEQIYVLPAGWRDAMWWTEKQVTNLRTILDRVKRDYNVNENMVVLSGVSDGGTGSYFMAMRDPTPYSSVMPMIGFVVVLRNPNAKVEGEVFPSNLRNRSFFVVNDGRDPLYPTAMVEPYIVHFAERGVDLTYRPQPDAEHDTSWWPSVKDDFESFVQAHPRDPLPDRLTWETSDPKRAGRLHWLIVNELGPMASDPESMDDLNMFTPPPQIETGLRVDNLTVARVVPDSNAEHLGFLAGDIILRMDDRDLKTPDDLLSALKTHAIGAPVRWVVSRGEDELELAGTFAPVEVRFPTAPLFARPRPWGRIDLTRTGNRIETVSRGVKSFTLLLSPDDFDFTQPVTVVTNGQVAFEQRVTPDLATLMRWAARDNDRTMLFGAEVRIQVR